MSRPGNLKDVYEQYVIACISKQCRQTKEHIDAHRGHFANNRHVSGFSEGWKQLTFALCADKAEGAYIYDTDGNQYLDCTFGFGVHLFGHAPAFLKKAIQDQLEKNMSLGPVSVLAGEVAALISRMTGNERCAFFNSGTEAVMVGLRLARAATGKNKIVIFEGGYHGTHDSLLVMKQHPATQEAIANVPGISQSLVQDTILLPFGHEKSLRFIEEHAEDIAAILTEPVRSRFPEETDPAFLHRLQQVCAVQGIAFILDEVITGFRMANGGAREVFALDPDLVIYGKILGGGMPLGVVAGKKKYLDFIDGGNWSFYEATQPASPMTFVAGTFCHHPLAMAAAKATLEYLDRNNNIVQYGLNSRTAALCNRLNEFCDSHHIPVQVAYFSSLFRFLVKGKGRLLYHALLKEKVYIWEGRTCFLSLAQGDHETGLLESRIKKCLVEMKSAGFFPYVKASPQLHEEEIYIQGGIEIEQLLNKEWLELAFAYACENIQLSTHRDLQKEIVFTTPGAEPGINQTGMTGCSLQLVVWWKDDTTCLVIKGAKSLFDGWSLTVFLRHLGKCYHALETSAALPANPFTGNTAIEQWIGTRGMNKKDPAYKAATVRAFVPASVFRPAKHFSFDYLLASFALALGEGRHSIGIPVSGQLLSRSLSSIGNYTCQVPVHVAVHFGTVPADIVNEIAIQLTAAKRDFPCWYTQNSAPLPVVFNMDHLKQDLSFGGKKAALMPVDDPLTLHDLVCNLTSLPGGLDISLKYKAGEPMEKVEKIMERFCSTLTETTHVFASGQ